ncbi:DUF397 domain-containing protein [Streptomyces varsoviensis]|uniref:DUF397 domain-containing protein n=1 Tax=Streptomyces varsoviensis TaxID=67373 RepID=UPI0009966990|nr:DUF397 domain-containing protein [Streptomyces varsoviensis]
MSAGLNWQKSSFSGGGDGNSCVELAAVDGVVWLRESDAPGEVITVTPAVLHALLRTVKASGSGHRV